MIRDKSKYKLALKLRQQGDSIRTIAKKLMISSSTASIWCRDIKLTSVQVLKLLSNSRNAARLKSYSIKRHQDTLLRHQTILDKSESEIEHLTNKEFFIAGVALYWAEGFKNISEGRIGFCNSDPLIIRFMMAWFKTFMNISDEEFVLRAEFNIAHKERIEEIEHYWSEVTKIPRKQFNSPFLQKSQQLRDYSKRGPYYGVLRIRVRKSLNNLIRIRGWIKGLSLAY